jgi:hypothetical protein
MFDEKVKQKHSDSEKKSDHKEHKVENKSRKHTIQQAGGDKKKIEQ